VGGWPDPRHWADRVAELAEANHAIHDRDCLNLNPATNVMNPRAEAMLSRPSSRSNCSPSRGPAGSSAPPTPRSGWGSGALANLNAFLATCAPGDVIIAPPPDVGGHVTHHAAGAAGPYGLRTVPAPIDPSGYTT
jgi:glycine hydroxymethyltransferase